MALQLDIDCVPGDREFMDAVWSSLSKLYGEVGASMASLALISYDSDRKFAVLRTNLSVVDDVRASLATIISIAGKSASVHVLAVSGTIKALHKNFRA